MTTPRKTPFDPKPSTDPLRRKAAPPKAVDQLPQSPPPEPTPPELAPPATPAPAASMPTLPPELAARLSPRETRAVLELVRGGSWREALDAAGYPQNARERKENPTPAIVDASQWLISQIAVASSVSREWILTNVVKLYRRAIQAEQVRDRRGEPTGEWKYDGATAAKCLSMLADFHPDLNRKAAGIKPSDVADLLAAVAARGRPSLPGDRARIVVEQSTPTSLPDEQPAQSST